MVITGLPRYVNERKFGIVIRQETICLTVDDIRSVPAIY